MDVHGIISNEAPIYATCVDLAIYKAAGEDALLEARRKIGYLQEGEVAIRKE